MCFAYSIMQLFIPTLQHVTMPSNSEQRNTMFDFAQKPVLTKMILGFMMDVLLLQYKYGLRAPVISLEFLSCRS